MTGLALWGPGAELTWWNFAVGAVVNSACAILGCFLVLRRMSMLGDAISHAVLPGIVVAYFLAGREAVFVLFLGAMIVGVLTALLVQTLSRYGGVAEDAGLGIVFTSLFSIGVILVSNFASRAHIDVDCVLYGDMDFVSIDRFYWGPFDLPRALPKMVLALGAVIVFVALFWKELKIASFDPALATAMGISAGLIHYLLMGMTAVVTVAAFEAVGAVLCVAMLIVPAATAYLLTDRLSTMTLWAVVVAVVSSLAGCLVAPLTGTNIAGMMAVAAGVQFALAVVFAPRYGLVGKGVRAWRLSVRIAEEDLTALLYRAEESQNARGVAGLPMSDLLAAVGRSLSGRWALRKLIHSGLVEPAGEGRVVLSAAGRRGAESLVRSHRLWEAYLVEHFQLPLDHLHEPAERIEHFIGPELQEQIAASLPKADTDPHGREIPKK
ncbi:MAG: metal ABC transporter permease [Pirellulales bacterium]